MRRLDLDVMEFLRRYLQHILPTGFMKVYYYGFMNPASIKTLEGVRQKVMGTLNTPDVINSPRNKAGSTDLQILRGYHEVLVCSDIHRSSPWRSRLTKPHSQVKKAMNWLACKGQKPTGASCRGKTGVLAEPHRQKQAKAGWKSVESRSPLNEKEHINPPQRLMWVPPIKTARSIPLYKIVSVPKPGFWNKVLMWPSITSNP